MKKIILSAIVLLIAITTKAQDASAVFSATEIVWYGLDFTKAHFVGQFDQGFGALPATGYDMKKKWIPEWNALIAKEPQNFNLKKAFKKDEVYYDLNPLATVNQKINTESCMSYNTASIDEKEIAEMVKNYPAGDKKEGVGLVFIVENFDKGMEMATVYVTFFDIKTKKILLTEKMQGKAIGVGMRNYWAGTIKNILKQIGETEYANWKKRK